MSTSSSPNSPHTQAPKEIKNALSTLTIRHIGFDEAIHDGSIIVHRTVAAEVTLFFKTALELHFPINKIIPISEYDWDDERSCLDNNSSAYNHRTIMGTSLLSKHALGTAFDINPVQNMYIRFDSEQKEIYRLPSDAIYNPHAKGTLFAEHPLVLLMKSLGWTWGGDWTPASGRIDYQHFEKIPLELAHYVQ